VNQQIPIIESSQTQKIKPQKPLKVEENNIAVPIEKEEIK